LKVSICVEIAYLGFWRKTQKKSKEICGTSESDIQVITRANKNNNKTWCVLGKYLEKK